MADELTPELQQVLDDASSRGTLLDSHPLVLAKKLGPDSNRDLRFQHIPRFGGNYSAPPSKDWSTHGGEISSDEFNARWHGKKQ